MYKNKNLNKQCRLMRGTKDKLNKVSLKVQLGWAQLRGWTQKN